MNVSCAPHPRRAAIAVLLFMAPITGMADRAATPLSEIPEARAPLVNGGTARADCPQAAGPLDQARQHFENGTMASALLSAETAALACDAVGYGTALLRAQIYLALDMPEAVPFAQAALDQSGGQADAYYTLGVALAREGRHAEAIPFLHAATSRLMSEVSNPTVTRAWRDLGISLEAEGYLTAAADAYRRFNRAIWDTHTEHRSEPAVAYLLDRSPLGTLPDEARLLGKLGAHEEALARIDLFAQSHIESRDAGGWSDPRPARYLALRALRCDALLAADRAPEALAVALDGAKPLVDMARLLRIAEAAGALDDVRTALCADVSHDEAYFHAARFGLALQDARRFAEAATVWRALCAARPADIDAGLALAACEAREDRIDAAVRGVADALRSAIAADEGREPDAPRALALARRDWAVWPAQGGAALSAAEAPGPIERLAIGMIAAEMGAADVVGAVLDQPEETGPIGALMLTIRSRVAAERFEWRQAADLAKRAVALDGRCADAWAAQGVALDALEEGGGGLEAYRRATELAPDNPRLAYALGIRLAQRTVTERYDVATQAQFDHAARLDPTNLDAFQELIETCIAARKVDLARTLLGTRPAPDFVDRRLRLSLALGGLAGQMAPRASIRQEAIRALRGLYAENPDDRRTARSLAMELMASAPLESLAILDQLSGPDPDKTEDIAELAVVARAAAEFDRALELCKKLTRRYPQQVDYWAELKLVALATLDMETFDQASAALTALRPGDSLAENDAQLLEAAGQWERADRLRDQLAAGVPLEDPSRIGERVLRARREGRLDDEEELLRDAAARGNRQAGRVLAERLAQTGRHDEALAILRAEPPPTRLEDDIDASFLRATLHELAGKFDLAVIEWRALVDRASAQRDPPPVSIATIRWLRALAKAGRADEALSAISEYRRKSADSLVELLYAEQGVLQDAERYDAYEAAAERFVRIAFDSDYLTEVRNNLAYHWADRGRRLADAERMARQAIAAALISAAYVDTLGWVAYKKGEFERAARLLRRAATFSGERDAVILDHCGDAMWRIGRHEDAVALWRKALDVIDEFSSDEEMALREPLQARIEAAGAGAEPPVAPTGSMND